MDRLRLLSPLVRETESRIVLLVLDGIGDLRTASQPQTPLEAATTPHLDRLAERSALGRLIPVAQGITPGSGPGHLALFGYPPAAPEYDIGRGVLEALGLGLELDSETIAARGNFATVDATGALTDRRAGRIPSAECVRLCARLNAALETAPPSDLSVSLYPGEGYRFVLLVRGSGLAPAITDTDPQQLGVPALRLAAENAAAATTVERLAPVIDHLQSAIRDEPRANSFLLRGFSSLPGLRSFHELYRLRAGAFAGYPLYRGVARACGMTVVECGKWIEEIVERVASRWADFDFFFLHVKQTDMAGEDGRFDDKVAAIERVDRALPALLELGPEVIAITGDHSTPVPMRAHSWHPVPLLVHAPFAFADPTRRFTEVEALSGALGTFAGSDLMGTLLAHAGKLAKFGA